MYLLMNYAIPLLPNFYPSVSFCQKLLFPWTLTLSLFQASPSSCTWSPRCTDNLTSGWRVETRYIYKFQQISESCHHTSCTNCDLWWNRYRVLKTRNQVCSESECLTSVASVCWFFFIITKLNSIRLWYRVHHSDMHWLTFTNHAVSLKSAVTLTLSTVTTGIVATSNPFPPTEYWSCILHNLLTI